MLDLPKLKLRERTGVYAPGRARIRQIMEAAFQILIEEGWAAVTLREIARRCGVRVGAVSYYYATRDDLMRDLIEGAIAPYNEAFAAIAGDPGLAAFDRLDRLIRFNLADMRTEKTTRLFPELWATANRDPFVAGLVEEMYALQREHFARLVAEINPGLGQRQRALVTLYLSAAQEGLTMFIGADKPFGAELAAVQNVATASLVALVATATDEMIDAGLPARTGGREDG